jgi:SPP1 gp7 family putative phage head morphogenesis protein
MNSKDILLYEKRKLLMKNVKRKKRLPKSPKWLYPYAIEREWVRELDQFVSNLQAFTIMEMLPTLRNIVNEARSELLIKTDAWSGDFDKLMIRLKLSLDEAMNTPDYRIKALNIGQKTSKWNSLQWQKTLRTVLGASTAFYEPWLQNMLNSFATNNVNLIRSLGQNTFHDIEQMALQGIRNGLRHEVIRDEIIDKFGATKSRAKLIARDQVSKLNGQLTKVRQQNLGIAEYLWRGVNDERQRPSHRKMNNRKCDWNDPTVVLSSSGKWINRSSIGGVALHPGQDYQCRCWAEAVFDFTAEDGTILQTPVPKTEVKKQMKFTHKQLQGTVKLPKVNSRSERVAKMEKTMKTISSPDLTDPKLLNDEAFEAVVERLYFYNRHFKTKPWWIGYERYTDAYALTIRRVGETQSRIALGPVWSVDYKFKEYIKEGMEQKWGAICDIGKEYKSVMDHEMFHVIQNSQMFEIPKPKQLEEIQKIYKSMTGEQIKQEVGEYAAKSVEEFGAECWSEYLNSSKPRPMAMKVGKLIHKLLEDKL